MNPESVPPAPTVSRKFADKVFDTTATLVCWIWFIFGFLCCFSWLYLAALLTRNPELQYQRLNSLFFRIFFRIVRLVAPRQKFFIDSNIKKIRSAVVVCNHLSYLDPLILITLFPRHRTIVKARFFTTPIFGWMIQKSGYLPSVSEGRLARLMVAQMETMQPYLRGGGNLFVFPEGTRSRDGKLGTLNKSALKIARMCSAPVYVLQLANTDKLFTPGKFLFNTRLDNTIEVKIIACIEPDYADNPPSAAQLEHQVRQAFTANRTPPA